MDSRVTDEAIGVTGNSHTRIQCCSTLHQARAGICGVLHSAGKAGRDIRPPAGDRRSVQVSTEERQWNTLLTNVPKQTVLFPFRPEPVISLCSLETGSPSRSRPPQSLCDRHTTVGGTAFHSAAAQRVRIRARGKTCAETERDGLYGHERH